MCFTKIYLLQPYMDFQKITFGQSCRATCFYGVSLTCSMIRYFLSLGLEDFGNQFVLGDQLIKRFVPEGHSSESLAQYCACSCKTERLNFWLESCNQRKLMPHKKIFFKEMKSLSYGVLNVKFPVYCVIKLRPVIIRHQIIACFPSISSRWILSLF